MSYDSPHDSDADAVAAWLELLATDPAQAGVAATAQSRTPARSPLVIGRGGDAGMQLPHPSVSRRHAEIATDPNGFWRVRDLGSRNGTFVNGQRVTERTLRHGDRLTVGDFTVRFELASPPPAAPPAAAANDDEAMPPSTVAPVRQAELPPLSSEHIGTALRFGQELVDVPDAGERLRRLTELPVFGVVRALWCQAVAVRERQDGTLELRTLTAPASDAEVARVGRPAWLSRTVLRAVLASGGPVVGNNLMEIGQFSADVTLGGASRLGAATVAACPIGAVTADPADGSRRADVLYVALPPTRVRVEWVAMMGLAAEQYRHAESVWAARAADAARAALEHEMTWARELQAHTLPRRDATAGLSVDWALRVEPCLAVGGDFADVIRRRDGRVLFVVADVSGKGLRAALVVSKLHTIFNADESDRPLAELMNAANRHLCTALMPGSFVTLAALLLDPASGRGTYVSAGHPPAMVVDEAGAVRTWAGENLPLGVAADPVAAVDVELRRGEWLVLHSDGASELFDAGGRMLGLDALRQTVSAACAGAADAEAVVTGIRSRLDDHRADAPIGDDLTLLVVRRTG